MADPVAVKRKQSLAQTRLEKAASEASRLFGVSIEWRKVPAFEKQLSAAVQLEDIAELIEQINKKQESNNG